MNWLIIKKNFKENKFKNTLLILAIALSITVLIGTNISINSIKNQYTYINNKQYTNANLIITSVKNENVSDNNLIIKNKNVKSIIKYCNKDYFLKINNQYNKVCNLSTELEKEKESLSYNVLDGILPNKSNECMITKAIKNQYNLNSGDSIKFYSKDGQEKLFIVTGIIECDGIGSENNGFCIITNIETSDTYGKSSYKILTNSNSDLKKIKADIENTLDSNYIVEYPSGKTEQFLNETNQIFKGLYCFGFISLFIAILFIIMVVNEFVLNMNRDFTILKCLGTSKSKIINIVIFNILIISTLGTILGTIFGIAFSNILIKFLKKLLNINNILVNINSGLNFMQILIILLIGVLIPALVSVPISIKEGNRKINSILKRENETKVQFKKNIITIIFFIATIIIIISTSNNYIKILALLLSLIFLVNITFDLILGIIKIIFDKLNILSSILFFSIVNRNKKQHKKTILLFSVILSFCISMFLTVSEMKKSIENISAQQFWGDAVITSEIGFKNYDFDKINYIKTVTPILQKFEDIQNINTKIIGLSTNEQFNSYNINSLTNNQIVISQRLMDKLNLKIGDKIILNSKEFNIVNKVKSIIHGGNICIINNTDFNNLFKGYSVTSNIISFKNAPNSNFADKLKNTINNKAILIKSMDESKKEYIKNNTSILILFYLFIFILLFVGILILVNNMNLRIIKDIRDINIKKLNNIKMLTIFNQYKNLSLFYSIYSNILGVIFGISLNVLFLKILNSTNIYDLKFEINWIFIASITFIVIIINLITALISILINYKKGLNKNLLI